MMPWRFSLREIVRRPARAVLTIVAIVLGVAAIVANLTAAHTTRVAFAELYAALAGKADLEVSAAGGGSFAASCLDTVEHTEGVASVAPLLERPTILYLGEGRRAKLLLLGVDFDRDQLVRDYELREGRMFDADDELVMEANQARSLGLAVNRRVKMLTKRGLKEFTIVGLLAPRGAAGYAHGAVLFVPLANAQRLFKAKGKIDALHVVLVDKSQARAAAKRIAARLPAELTVRPPAARTQLADETLLAAQQGLDMAGALALVASAFIVINTLLMNVAERRRELAMLRAIGATPRQVMQLVLGEALLYGIVGTAIGLGVGMIGAYWLTRSVEAFLQTPLPAIRLSWPPVAVGAGMGLILSVLAAYVPARKAGQLSPLEGLGAVAGDDAQRLPKLVTLGAPLVMATTLVVVVACILGWLPSAVAIPAAALMLAACASLFAVVLGPLVRAFQAILLPRALVEMFLALGQLMRRRLRTSLTVGVIFVSLSTAIGLGNTILNNTHDVENWFHRTVAGDFFVRALMPDMASGLAADMPDGWEKELRELPGVAHIGAVRFVAARAGGQSVIVIARSFEADTDPLLDLREGDRSLVVSQLRAGQAVIGSVLAQRARLSVGDELSIESGDRSVRVRVAGIANEYLVGGLALYLERDAARRLLDIAGADAFAVRALPGQRGKAQAALAAFCAERGLLLQSFAELAQMVDGMTQGIVGGLWVLLALGIVVSACGMVNTLSMNVLEQARELALLRATGMTRPQLRRMIVFQAAAMGLIGLLPGVLAGIVMSYLINLSSLPVLGRAIDFSLHPWFILASVALALAVVIASAWLPASRATRLTLADALRCE